MENNDSNQNLTTPQIQSFAPVPTRVRHDGWTPKKQVEFIEALASSGCVDQACRRVGRSRQSAYDLRLRPEAGPFRAAWEAALEHGVKRMNDAAFSRAINGVAIPIYYKGEQVGERRHFDERLTMFMLRYYDPLRFGKWLDRESFERAEDGAARLLALRIAQLFDVATEWLHRKLDVRRAIRMQERGVKENDRQAKDERSGRSKTHGTRNIIA
ncbi:hypothetical protein [Sphingorhabdus sp.]|jgi:hypothetical protein|uniref:hypothetical protein n=1 Tax=Sphingorhabdus sp. TaxID=1902408 RepID=UPI003BAFD271|nr:hypothetical protein [Sphingomonadales bacterium]